MNVYLPFLSCLLMGCIPEINNQEAEDRDGDGFSELEGDCDDESSQTYPGAAYLDSTTDCMTDMDKDGRGDSNPVTEGVVAGTDCDDSQICQHIIRLMQIVMGSSVKSTVMTQMNILSIPTKTMQTVMGLSVI